MTSGVGRYRSLRVGQVALRRVPNTVPSATESRAGAPLAAACAAACAVLAKGRVQMPGPEDLVCNDRGAAAEPAIASGAAKGW